MKHRFIPTLLILPGLCTGCFIPKLSVSPYLATYEASGHFAAVADSGSLSASDEVSVDDLGLDGSETGIGVRADFEWLGAHLSLSTLDTSFSGNGTIDSDITLGGDTITAGTDVDSDLDLSTLTGAVTWDFVPTDFINAGLGLGVIQVDLDMDIDPDGADSISTDASELIPVVVGRASFSFDDFDIGATVAMMSVDVGDIDGSIMDIDIAASYSLVGGDDHLGGAIVLGYRSFSIESEYDDDNSDIDFDFEVAGPYIGVRVSF